MSHLDDETLASLALGEPVDASARAHAAECAQCRDEVREYERTVSSLETLRGAEPLAAPPARVWDAIAADVATDRANPATASSPPEPTPARDDLAARRESKRAGVAPWLVGVAAAAGLVIGGVAVATLVNPDDAGGELVAQAALADLETEADAGTARVEQRADGTTVLVLETEYEPVDGAALEVWLIDENVEGMISLGHVTEATDTFVIPPGFDVAAHPIVDVSVEPFDGDPTHSGDSITRGVLDL